MTRLYELVDDQDVCFDDVRADSYEEAVSRLQKDWGRIPSHLRVVHIEDLQREVLTKNK